MIYICADDYGFSTESSERIKACAGKGGLNKISVFPNGEKLPETNSLVFWSLHLNLVEGKALSDPEEIGLLVDENGYFRHSFGGLLKLSFSSEREILKQQIYRELKAQINRWQAWGFGEKPLFLDSHQHTHMIPLVFRTLMQVIRDCGVKVGYLRIPSEPIMPYLLTPSLYLTYRPVNLLKQWILKFCSLVNQKELHASGIPTAYFMGILFSGTMDYKRVCRILPHYLRLAEKNEKDIEMLFHPGYVKQGEALLDANKKGFCEFYYSEGRQTEFDTLKRFLSDFDERSL